MSDQGNIIFVPKAPSNRPILTIQTGRWAGYLMHRTVAEFLYNVDGSLQDQDDFLSDILSFGWLPIRQIGNEDVPTIVVDFNTMEVRILSTYSTPAMHFPMDLFHARLNELDSTFGD